MDDIGNVKICPKPVKGYKKIYYKEISEAVKFF
jgi:hypothetical protein